jgi:hypothetical protein
MIIFLLFIFYKPQNVESKTELFEFDLIDVTANSLYPAGSKELHCFDIDASGKKTYVRGTYGNFGYFEGKVDRYQFDIFYVNWFETASSSLEATAGSAILNYSYSWNEVTGPFWTGGSGDISNSYGNWHSINGEFKLSDNTTEGSNVILSSCLTPGSNYRIDRNLVNSLSEPTISSSSYDGVNEFCRLPVGVGVWLGSYQYVYREGVVERGTYGIDSLTFLGESGMGFVGTWKAISGPYQDQSGSALYSIVGVSPTASVIVGFFCFTNEAGIRTNCTNEYYEVLPDTILNCPSLYKFGSDLDPLFDVVKKGTTLRSSCGDDPSPSSSDVYLVLTIVFLITTVILSYTFLYILVVIKKQRESAVVPLEPPKK